MRILGAYLLAVLGGNESPDAAAINAILASVGATAEAELVNQVISQLAGKDLEELIAEGSKKISAVPTGGAASGAAPAAGAAAAAAPVEEKKKSSSSESAGGDMGFSLFD